MLVGQPARVRLCIGLKVNSLPNRIRVQSFFRMAKARIIGVVTFVAWASGCSVESKPIDSEQPADSAGGSENASGGQGGDDSGSGGTIVDIDSLLVAEGEVLSGSCMAPGARGPCEAYLVVAGRGYTEEEGYMHCAQRYDDAFGETLWRAGEHCPLDGGAYMGLLRGVCKNGSLLDYAYSKTTPTHEWHAQVEQNCFGEYFAIDPR